MGLGLSFGVGWSVIVREGSSYLSAFPERKRGADGGAGTLSMAGARQYMRHRRDRHAGETAAAKEGFRQGEGGTGWKRTLGSSRRCRRTHAPGPARRTASPQVQLDAVVADARPQHVAAHEGKRVRSVN